MTSTHEAHAAYQRREWDSAHELLRAAGRIGELTADDLSILADSEFWLGLVEESVQSGEAAYRAHLADNTPREAAGQAILVGVNHLVRGEVAPGLGWLERAAALVSGDPDCSEAGYLRYLTEVEIRLAGPDPDDVIRSARAVGELGRRLNNVDLIALGTAGEGRVLIKIGNVPEGMALLDSAMSRVQADELTPSWAGNLYCHMIDACLELGDVSRAQQWTQALDRWIFTMPAATLPNGICRLHQAQLLHWLGSWDRAKQIAEQVCVDFSHTFRRTAAEAYYVVGEIDRLRGQQVNAEAAYLRAGELGRDPQPGLALLRMQQGNTDAALAALRTAHLARPHDRLACAVLCDAQVEVALTAQDTVSATAAQAELERTATDYRSPWLLAAAARDDGAIRLMEGDPAGALPVLRDACRRWLDLDAAYEAARTRLLLAMTYAKLEDTDSAEREQLAGLDVLARLNADTVVAAPDVRPQVSSAPDGLSLREVEILRCVAVGQTNKQIAAALVISDKTVQRHLANIFTKLSLTSRTQAAAYAYEHRLASKDVRPPPGR